VPVFNWKSVYAEFYRFLKANQALAKLGEDKLYYPGHKWACCVKLIGTTAIIGLCENGSEGLRIVDTVGVDDDGTQFSLSFDEMKPISEGDEYTIQQAAQTMVREGTKNDWRHESFPSDRQILTTH